MFGPRTTYTAVHSRKFESQTLAPALAAYRLAYKGMTLVTEAQAP